MRIGSQFVGMERCPHCSVANPFLPRLWLSDLVYPGNGSPPSRWATFACATCGGLLLAQGSYNDNSQNPFIIALYPSARNVDPNLPEPAGRFLQQAFNTLHAPDAAVVMAGSAVDAMLKALGLVDGSLYVRINQAVSQNKLTQGMADWAHEVRLGSNRPRHADADNPHVSTEEATQAVEFAAALGNFLFVITAQVQRGITAARGAAAT